MVCFFSCCSLRDGFDILMLFAVVITGACVMHCIGSQAAQFAGAARLLWVSRLVLCVCGPWREYVLKLPRLMWGTKRQALCKPRPVWCRQPWIYVSLPWSVLVPSVAGCSWKARWEFYFMERHLSGRPLFSCVCSLLS